MLSLNPRTDLPRFIFPDDFWIPEVCEKYDQMLAMQNYPIKDIRVKIAESIKRWEIPSLGQNVHSQKVLIDGKPVDSNHPSSESPYQAQEKLITVVFRMDDGYINWLCLWEHMWLKLAKTKETAVSDFPIMVKNIYGQTMFTMVFKNSIMLSMDGFGVDYQNVDRAYREFTVVWQAETWKVVFTPPTQNTKKYNPKDGTVSEITYEDEPKLNEPCRPSL